MNEQEYVCLPVIPYQDGDDIVHTDLHPFCDDITGCPCHNDVMRFWKYCDTPYEEGLLTKTEQARLFYGEMLLPRSEEGRP